MAADGQRAAEAFVQRLQAGQAADDELAGILAPMYGQRLRGFCQALQRALMAGGQ